MNEKAAIVCALQHKPHLCILDEPTGGLDPLMQREFFSILKERNAEGTTIFLSSHILSEIHRSLSIVFNKIKLNLKNRTQRNRHSN